MIARAIRGPRLRSDAVMLSLNETTVNDTEQLIAGAPVLSAGQSVKVGVSRNPKEAPLKVAP